MGRPRTRSERINHFFGDMVDTTRVAEQLSLRKPTKKEVRQTLKELMDELGLKQCTLITNSHDEYGMRYR